MLWGGLGRSGVLWGILGSSEVFWDAQGVLWGALRSSGVLWGALGVPMKTTALVVYFAECQKLIFCGCP